MPCNSDYMYPSSEEVILSKALTLLDELDGKPFDQIRFSGFHPRAYMKHPTKAECDAAVVLLCERIQATDPTKHSLELQMWWRDHQKADAERVEREKRIYSTETLRKAALRKLTPEERVAFGYKPDEE